MPDTGTETSKRKRGAEKSKAAGPSDEPAASSDMEKAGTRASLRQLIEERRRKKRGKKKGY